MVGDFYPESEMLENEGVPVEVEVLEFKAKYFTLKYTCFIMLFKIYITPFIYSNELLRSYNSVLSH